MKFKLLASVFLLLSLNSFAGREGGNGADVVICAEEVILLDRYEGESRGLSIDIPGNTIVDKVDNILNRLKKYDFYSYLRIRKEVEELLKDIQNYEQGGNSLKKISFVDYIQDVQDSYEIVIPDNCYVKQLVIRKEKTDSDQKAYFIHEDRWRALSFDDRVLTIFHEAWYKLITDFSVKDSRFARLINTYIASTKMEEGGYHSYLTEFFKKNKLGGRDIPYKIFLPVFSKNKEKENYTGEFLRFSDVVPKGNVDKKCYGFTNSYLNTERNFREEGLSFEEIKRYSKEQIDKKRVFVSNGFTLPYPSVCISKLGVIEELKVEIATTTLEHAGRSRFFSKQIFDGNLNLRRSGANLKTFIGLIPPLWPLTLSLNSLIEGEKKDTWYTVSYLLENKVKVKASKKMKSKLIFRKELYGKRKKIEFYNKVLFDQLSGRVIEKD